MIEKIRSFFENGDNLKEFKGFYCGNRHNRDPQLKLNANFKCSSLLLESLIQKLIYSNWNFLELLNDSGKFLLVFNIFKINLETYFNIICILFSATCQFILGFTYTHPLLI